MELWNCFSERSRLVGVSANDLIILTSPNHTHLVFPRPSRWLHLFFGSSLLSIHPLHTEGLQGSTLGALSSSPHHLSLGHLPASHGFHADNPPNSQR